MPRAALSLSLLLLVAFTALAGCRSRDATALSSEQAAAALRTSPTFTTRPGSTVGRDLVEIVAVRRIGRSSTEVEFTWRDTTAPAGQPAQPLRTSMALFRLRDNGEWALASLYKVD
jgi:hypothetical protein